MNIKELMAGQSSEAVAAALADRLDIAPDRREKAIGRIVTWMEGLKTIQPVETGCLLLGIICVNKGKELLEARLYRKENVREYAAAPSQLDDLEDIQNLDEDELQRLTSAKLLPDSYGFKLSPWAEILGYEVDERNVRDVGGASLCAAVIWEMTFFGLDEQAVEAERQKLDEAFRQAEEIQKLPEAEQDKYYLTAEEVFANWGLPPRTEEEQQAAHQQLCDEILTNCLRTRKALKKYGMRL